MYFVLLFSFIANFFRRLKHGSVAKPFESLDQKLVTSLTPWRLPRFYQLKFLPKFLTNPEKRLLKIAIIAAIAGAIILAFSFFSNSNNFGPRSGGILREGLISYPRFINPVFAATEADRDLSRLIYSGLVKYDEDGILVVDLAAKFEISADGKAYLFSLKNALWHDGEEVRAQDVDFTIRMIQDPLWKSPLWRSFKGVKSEIVDDKTIRFTLEKSYASFLSLLTVGILPEHLWQSVTPQNLALAVWNTKPVGSGPWRFGSLAKTAEGRLVSYTLKNNEQFYGPKPWLSKLVFSFYDDRETGLQALRESKIDGFNLVPSFLEKDLPLKRVNAHRVSFPSYTAIFFNGVRNNFLADKQIRQALAKIVDTQNLTSVISGVEPISGPLAQQFLPQEFASPQPVFDLDEANALLEGAGFKKKDNFWQKGDKFLEINLVSLADPIYFKTVNLIKDGWEKAGIKVGLNILPAKEFKEAVKTRNYEALLWSQVVGQDPDLFPFWHSSQIGGVGLNLTSFRNHKMDALLEEARSALDIQKRQSLYGEFQQLMQDEMPAIFLFREIYLYPVAKKVKGVNVSSVGTPSDRFAGLNNWYVNKTLK